jgi:hypothetical protein
MSRASVSAEADRKARKDLEVPGVKDA